MSFLTVMLAAAGTHIPLLSETLTDWMFHVVTAWGRVKVLTAFPSPLKRITIFAINLYVCCNNVLLLLKLQFPTHNHHNRHHHCHHPHYHQHRHHKHKHHHHSHHQHHHHIAGLDSSATYVNMQCQLLVVYFNFYASLRHHVASFLSRIFWSRVWICSIDILQTAKYGYEVKLCI